MNPDWLHLHEGEAPLLVSLPHTGTLLPEPYAERFVSRERALRDTDWWIDRLYDFAAGLGATVLRTAVSRSIVDVNRDPSGASLYPGQATTELCPTTTFDGRPLYRDGAEPDAEEVGRRKMAYHAPYHDELARQVVRLRERHARIVVYDCHSIRSAIPRLFPGELPHFNVGTNGGRSCDGAVTALVERICDASAFSRVTDGRFKGGWITRSLGRPEAGVHAVQMELACRGYMDESEDDVPAPFDEARAAPMRAVLVPLLTALRDWAG
jgi:N-formylglutamate amidohydrolase